MAPAPPSPSAIVCVFEKLSNFHLFCGSRNIREMKPFLALLSILHLYLRRHCVRTKGVCIASRSSSDFTFMIFLDAAEFLHSAVHRNRCLPHSFIAAYFFCHHSTGGIFASLRHFCVACVRERGRQNGSITSHRNRPSLLLPLVTVMEEGLRSINACAEKKKSRGGIL